MTDKIKNRKFIVFLTFLTVILCAAAFYAGKLTAVHRSAAKRLSIDIAAKQEEYDVLLAEKNDLEWEINDQKQKADANSEMNVKMKDDEEKLSLLTAQIEAAKADGEALDMQLNEKQSLESQVNSTSSSVEGKLLTLKEGTYACPANIEAGRYTISAAEGNIIVYGTNGSIRISKSLAAVDGNEYTVALKDGEKLKVDKEVSIKGSGRITEPSASAVPARQ